MKEKQTPEPYMFTIDGAVAYSGWSRSRIQDAINAEQLDARQVGRRTMIVGASLRALCDALPKVTRRAHASGKKAEQQQAA